MAGNSEGGLTLPKVLDLRVVVFLAALGASFWAQWAIFTERSENQAATITQLYGRVDHNADRLRDVERDLDVVKTQIEYITETNRKHTELEAPK